MNNTYSIIYNTALGEYQVASEKTKTRRSKVRKLATAVLLSALLTPALAQPFNITNTDPAVIASTNIWADYDFQTTAIDGDFFPVYPDANGTADNWSTRLEAYVLDPTNQTNKDNFDTANNTLQINVTNYLTVGNGYLKVNTDKTFLVPSSTASDYSAMIIGSSNPAQSNDSLLNQLVAVTVADGAKLIYKPIEQDVTKLTGRLFEVRSTGTLIINTEGNSSIEFNGFRTRAGGVIYNNSGNVYIGSNATFSNNRSNEWGGAIYNGGNVYLGSNVTFSNNSSTYGGAISNTNGNVYIGSNATFSNNSSSAGGAINNNLFGNVFIGSHATFSNNSASSYGGAIVNWTDHNTYLGSNATFNNNSASFYGGAIRNRGNLNIDTGINGETTLFTGNLENGKANSIAMEVGTLNITGAGTLDMRDPFYANSNSFTFSINKSGTSTWKLSGESLGGISTTRRFVTLNINEGTLYLYKADEVDNSHINTDPTNNIARRVGVGSIKDLVAMNLGTATTTAKLIAGGGNTLSGGTLTLENNATIGFRVDSAPSSTNPIMEWQFDALSATGGYTVDIMGRPFTQGDYYLLKSNQTHNLGSSNLTYFGVNPSSLDRIGNKFFLIPDPHGASDDLYLKVSGQIANGLATWNDPNPTTNWDVGTRNWIINSTNTHFLSGDEVIFGDLNLKDQTISINAAGSQFELNGMSVNSATNYTFNGDGLTLMAGKSITKNGTGILAFNNRVKGNVNLNGGIFIIGDSSQNKNAHLEGDVTASSGTTVGGHGTIAGIVNLKSGATLSPGNSIGTITVGELNLQDGSRVVLDVMPTGESDKIVVKRLGGATGITTGNVTIGQNVMLNIVAGAGQWAPSTSYSFLTAEGTITGNFAGVTSNLAFLTGTLNANSTGFNLINTSDSGSTDPDGSNNVVIDFIRNNVAFATFAQTYNQRAVANSVEFIPQNHAVYKAIVSMSGEQVRLAYDNLSGELYASTENVLFHNATKLQDGMLSRIHEGTDGLWIKGWRHNSHIKADGNAAKVENKGAGLLLGYDFNLNQNILIGAAVGFEDSKIKIKDHNRKGENKVKSTHFMVYGNADLEVLEIKAGLSYSALRFKANRYINIPTLAGNLHSKYHGHQIHAFIEASKTFNVLENYDVAPYVNLAYTDVKTKSFVEEGSQAALSSKGQSNNRTSLTIGVKNDWYFDTERNLGVTADIGWKHTFGDKTIDKRFNFVNTNTDFKIKSASVNKNSAVIGLGFKGKYQDLTIDVGYQGEFNNKVKDHAFGAKVKWSF